MKVLGCDDVAIAKAKDERLPAAVWTVFHPADADKIRDCLNKKAQKPTTDRPLNFDPILDGNVNLDTDMIKTLKDDYSVTPFVIAQFQGEAVFIPAGAPRQVRRLRLDSLVDVTSLL